jgi:hypothetical protein
MPGPEAFPFQALSATVVSLTRVACGAFATILWMESAMLFNRMRFAAVALGLTTFACSGDSTGPGGSGNSVTGTYTLRTINGTPLPVVLAQAPGYLLRITSATLTLNSPNTFSTVGTYQETTGSTTVTVTDTCTGTYTLTGTSIAFSEAFSPNTDCGGNYNGSWDGLRKITVALDATVQAVFEK